MNNISFLLELLSLLPDLIAWKDIKGHYLGCNNNFAKLLSFEDKEKIIGKTDHDLFPAHKADYLLKIDNLVTDSGQEITFKDNLAKLDLAPNDYLITKKPIFDANKAVKAILIIVKDIREKELLERELQTFKEDNEQLSKKYHEITGEISNITSVSEYADKVRDFFENIVSIMPGHIYWLDKNNVYLGCNDLQAQHAHLKSRKEIIGKTNYDMPWKEQADKLNELNNKVMSTGIPHSAEEFAVMSNGPGFYLSHKVPLRNSSGQVIGILGISFDITERKKMEQELIIAKETAEAANNVKTEFLANMSHDLRTPFSGILSMSNILYQKETDPVKKEYIGYIKDSGESLLKLLTQILELSTTESHPIVYTTFSILDLVKETLNLIAAQAKLKNIKIEYNCININIHSDKMRVSRILLNFLSNAVKFTNSGQIRVDVNVKEKVTVSVEDTGPGIPTESLQLIFDKFSKLESSYKDKKFKGAGIGLFIAKQFALDLNGSITVKSEVGKGSTFILTIPYLDSDYL